MYAYYVYIHAHKHIGLYRCKAFPYTSLQISNAHITHTCIYAYLHDAVHDLVTNTHIIASTHILRNAHTYIPAQSWHDLVAKIFKQKCSVSTNSFSNISDPHDI
jgi:hypothetical protein